MALEGYRVRVGPARPAYRAGTWGNGRTTGRGAVLPVNPLLHLASSDAAPPDGLTQHTEAVMGAVYNDLDKRILAEFARQNAAYRQRDTDIIHEMAAIWTADGGDSGGLMDGYIDKLLAEIDRLNGVKS